MRGSPALLVGSLHDSCTSNESRAKNKGISIEELWDQSRPTTAQFLRSRIAPIPLPAFAATLRRPGCAFHDGNSKSPALPRPAIASSRELFASELGAHPQSGMSGAPTALAHQSTATSLPHRASFSTRRG